MCTCRQNNRTTWAVCEYWGLTENTMRHLITAGWCQTPYIAWNFMGGRFSAYSARKNLRSSSPRCHTRFLNCCQWTMELSWIWLTLSPRKKCIALYLVLLSEERAPINGGGAPCPSWAASSIHDSLSVKIEAKRWSLNSFSFLFLNKSSPA